MQTLTSGQVQGGANASALRQLLALTCLILFADVVWAGMQGWSVAVRGLGILSVGVVGCLIPLLLDRYRRDVRISTTVTYCALLLCFQASAASLSYLVVGTQARLVDETLANWDRSLGFDWLSLLAWMQQHPLVRSSLQLAYHSGLPQLTFVVVFLGLTGRRQRLEQFLALFFLATLVTIAISGLYPAAGAWKHYGVLQNFDAKGISHFEPLRDGRLRVIPLDSMQGLISIPSLHAAIAILLMHATRGLKVLGPLFAVLNIAMLASTPIDGGHYLVDVLAGSALAVVLIAWAHRAAFTQVLSRLWAPRAVLERVRP